MKKLDFFTIPYQTILKNLDVKIDLSEYLRSRPDILEKTDIFIDNSRSLNQNYKRFDLFNKVETINSDTIIIPSFYLELFEFFGNSNDIHRCFDLYSRAFPNNKIIFQWNHDLDFYPRYKDVEKFNNIYIINFNTSKALKNDIIVPFWVINTKFYEEPKKFFAGFIGSINNNLRGQLKDTIKGKDKYIIESHLNQHEFLTHCSQCLFSLCPKGQGLSSYRFFEAFHLNSIPVLIADNVVLPFREEIDYDQISIRIPEDKISDFDYIDQKLKKADSKIMLENINKIKYKFSLQGVQEEIYKRLI